MNNKITWMARLLMAGLLYVQPQTSMSASCVDDAKSCQNSSGSEQSTLQYKSSSVLENDNIELNQELTANTDLKLTQPDSKTSGLKFNENLEATLSPVNHECSPLRWTEERTNFFEQKAMYNEEDFVEQIKEGNLSDPLPPGGIRVSPPDPKWEDLEIRFNKLAAVDVGEPVFTILRPPITITGASLIGDLPGNLQFDYLNGRMAIYTPCRDGLQTGLHHPSTTTRFQIRINNGMGSTNLDVVLPVNLYTGWVIQVLNHGDSVDRVLEYSGGPVSCVGMPREVLSRVPCGPVSWSYQSLAGGPIPLGVVLQPSIADGRAHLIGVVQDTAYSSVGKIQLNQQQQSYITDARFEVPVSLTRTQRSQIAELREIERNTYFSFQLPQPRGGDGFNYQWRIDYSRDQLPDGLIISADTISGRVSAGAEIGSREPRLIVSSSLNSSLMRHPETTAEMSFQLSVPFSLWTQNTFLRPPDLPRTDRTESDIVSAIIGAFLCGLPCALEGYLANGSINSAIQIAYDIYVQNTIADNQQRMGHILNELSTHSYDIVALQEVFQFDPAINGGNTLAHISQLRSGAASQYHQFDGPPADGFKMTSGLTMLVRRGLATNPVFRHRQDVYPNIPLMLNVPGQIQPKFNFDALAQKGMTIDRVHFGPDPDDYVQVVNTHMQSGSEAVFDNLRATQQNELYNFIALHADATHPVVIVGDMNVTEAIYPLYSGMLSRLGIGLDSDLFRVQQNMGPNAADGFTMDPSRNLYAHEWGGTAIERLDYILVRQGTQYQLVADSVQMTDSPVTTTLCSGWQLASLNRQCYLSDHFGLSAQLRLVRP